MPQQTFDYFFDLPLELRELILAHLCVFPSPVLVGAGPGGRCIALTDPAAGGVVSTPNPTAAAAAVQENDDDDDDDTYVFADPPVDLLRASPVLYREAGGLYYGRNVFRFDAAALAWGGRQRQRCRRRGAAAAAAAAVAGAAARSDEAGSGAGRRAGDVGTATLLRVLAHPDTAGARRRMRRAAVALRRLGGFVTDVLVPQLADMVLNGALRRLRVDLVEGGNFGAGPGWSAAAGDQTANPQLRALLVLMADPDMEKAEFRVPRGRHNPFWCRFHEGQRCAMMMSGSLPPGGGHRGRAAGFVELDLHGLLQACVGDAADFRIKKVASAG